MKVVTFHEPGGPEALIVAHRNVPVPTPEEILIEVHAAGVNRPDVMQRQGKYPPPPGASDVPGLEVAGHVACTGNRVSRWKAGDAVVALVAGGGYAELCLAHEAHALPLPPGMTMSEGAALPETTFTVWHNVFQRGRLRAGEWLLVHGGTSGIGTTAIQLAKAFGARVATTAGSDEKCRAAEGLGADLAINYKNTDFVAALHERTDGQGVDVILDMVGGDYLARNIAAAAEDARIVQISTLAGAVTEIDLWKLLSRRITLTGSTLRSRSIAFKAELAREVEREVWPLIANGRFRPLMDRVFPLERAAEAHRLMESGNHVGKIVLDVLGTSDVAV